jgi:hypothetical protein
MMHVWVVPGCESDYGVFSGGNPALVFRGAATADLFDPALELAPKPPGCGSGAAIDGELGFDQGGHGPSIR